MLHNIQYITNQTGVQTSVIVPINDWSEILKELEFLKKEHSYFQTFENKNDLSEIEIKKRAIISENQIKEGKYTDIELLEQEMKTW